MIPISSSIMRGVMTSENCSASKPALRRIGCRNKASRDGDRRFLLLPSTAPPAPWFLLRSINSTPVISAFATNERPVSGAGLTGRRQELTCSSCLAPPPQARHVGDGRGQEGKTPRSTCVSTLCLRCGPRTPNSQQNAAGVAPSPTAGGRLNFARLQPWTGLLRTIMLARGFSGIFSVMSHAHTRIHGSELWCAMWRGI